MNNFLEVLIYVIVFVPGFYILGSKIEETVFHRLVSSLRTAAIAIQIIMIRDYLILLSSLCFTYLFFEIISYFMKLKKIQSVQAYPKNLGLIFIIVLTLSIIHS